MIHVEAVKLLVWILLLHVQTMRLCVALPQNVKQVSGAKGDGTPEPHVQPTVHLFVH